MKTRNITTIIVVLLAIFTISCEDQGVFWGKTDYYDNFLFVKYEPVRMEQTLVFDFNEDAMQFLENDIHLELVEKNEKGDLVVVQGIKLYKDNVLCDNNLLTINKNDKEVNVGIEFTGDARDGTYTLYFREKGTSGIDRIDYQELDMGLSVVKNTKLNPLLLGLIWFVVILLLVCIIWILFLKPILYNTFKVRQLILITEQFKTIKIKGAKQVVCSHKNKKQSFMSRLFTGKIIFVQDPFFTEDFVITPRDKKSVRVRTTPEFKITGPILTVGETMTVEHVSGNSDKTATIEIN